MNTQLTQLTQLTQQDKARVFAMYLGSEAKCNQNFMPNRNSINADGHLIMSPSILADCYEAKSYHLPYKGVNLFDAGLAIRKTKTITQ